MKKLLYVLSISSMMLLLTSCFEKIDNWYTNTAGYDGRYTVALSCEEYDDDNTVIEDGEELMIFNSAANIANEIIIDTHIAGIAVKGKYKVNGDPSNFVGAGNSLNLYYTYPDEITNDNHYRFIYEGDDYAPSQFGSPDELGEEYEAIQYYASIVLESGKIVPKGATTIGGNKSDGVKVELVIYTDELVIESYETPQETWANPSEPELGWRVKAGSRRISEEMTEHWTLEGYRYTGYPEDDPHTQPPVITK